MANKFQEKIHLATEAYPELTIYYGTGYPIDRPHIFALDRGSWSSVRAYPEGDNGLSGIGLGRKVVSFD